ncbi:MAG: bifunctional hydroxymethylpyrimidine kinase/phosphomethylpyrimidine kinase [Alphaproteobacteria bacterium]|nr:bifunctional hydroxymethylpyrimidine kinase/phosphomethylpyrimidine kinase [Alphaproteobacteria bacterium]
MTSSVPVALTIAGSDSGGGAGIQADLKTFLDRGVYGASVLTAVTAQNTLGVRLVHPVPVAAVQAQLQAVLEDLPPGAIKIGMLATAALVEAVAEALREVQAPIVLDPVMVATSGDPLLDPEAVAALRDHLLPLCAVVTPNLPELALLGGAAWLDTAPVPVLVKGGHATDATVTDRLVWPDGAARTWTHPRVSSRNTHGTGCTLSSAIAAELARGRPLEQAVGVALDYVARLIAGSADHALGAGHGPLLHGLVP